MEVRIPIRSLFTWIIFSTLFYLGSSQSCPSLQFESTPCQQYSSRRCTSTTQSVIGFRLWRWYCTGNRQMIYSRLTYCVVRCPGTGQTIGQWKPWTSCSKSCGVGTQTRRRSCEGSCSNVVLEQSRSCKERECPVNGRWTGWSSWSPCTKTCGSGNRSRRRSCTNPPPRYGGSVCPGNPSQIQTCNQDPCTTIGSWGRWSTCSASCGTGSQTRSRGCSGSCSNVQRTQTRSCNVRECPVNGGWSNWSQWSQCSGGRRFRRRSCTNPAPQYGGTVCSGRPTEIQSCSQPAVVDGRWSQWGSWSTCSKQCNGQRSRQRTCTNPSPENGGRSCSGSNSQTSACNQGSQCQAPCGVGVVAPNAFQQQRIVGGTTAEPNSWPWQVLLLTGRNQAPCGGTLVSDQWLVTAGHCVASRPNTGSWTVRVGEHDLTAFSSTERDIPVAKIVLHPNYNENNLMNDIALMQLSQPVTHSNKVSPVCLPTRDVSAGTKCVATGWGVTEESGGRPSFLQQVVLSVVDRSTCRSPSYIGSFIQNTMVCAGGEDGKDACNGDSGGPLVCVEDGHYALQGVTSFGIGCGRPMKPGVYTRVAIYVDWIRQHINQ